MRDGKTATADTLDPADMTLAELRLHLAPLIAEAAIFDGWSEEALEMAALKTAWNSADIMWRLAGDTATDWNHYTKRTILAGIYGATLAAFVGDESEDKQDTRAFLDRRIDGVMKFEKAKAQLLGNERESFSMMRFLGRLRYPVK